MRFKLKGRYNTFSNTYNKARVYFTMSGNLESVIGDLYRMGLSKGTISINGSPESNCEIAELSIKGNKATITFLIDTNEASITNIAKYAFDRNVEVELSYDKGDAVDRVSSQYYSYLIKLMERVSSMAGMGNVEELRVAINQTYGYYVPINEYMRTVDANQLKSLVVELAKEIDPSFVDFEPNHDSFITARVKKGKCTICEKPYTVIKDGFPLCGDHEKTLKSMGLDRFKRNHFLN